VRKLILTLVLILLAVPAFAQRRGALTNVFASWYTVETTLTTVPMPHKSRDVYVLNGTGSATDLFVDLRGGSLAHQLFVTNSTPNPSIIQLGAGDSIDLRDFVTDSVKLITETGTASPVTVIITY